MGRKAGTGVIATIILMVSFTLLFGSIYYLLYLDPFKYPTEQPQKNVLMNNNEEPPEPTTNVNKTIEEAISELKHEGCTFVSVKFPVYIDNPQYLGYDDFKTKAIETKLIVLSPSDVGIILIVQNADVQFIWVP